MDRKRKRAVASSSKPNKGRKKNELSNCIVELVEVTKREQDDISVPMNPVDGGENEEILQNEEVDEKSQSEISEPEFDEGAKYPCSKCNKTYSKPSNLYTHIRNKHKGIRWVCPTCKEVQTSKYSHIRHIQNVHPGVAVGNVDENMFEMADKVEMTSKAKSAFIAKLITKVETQAKTIEAFKKNSNPL